MSTNLDQVKRLALRAMGRMCGQPMSSDALRDTLHIVFPSAPIGDLDQAVVGLEQEGYIVGRTVDMVGVMWALTPLGQLKVAQL